MDITEHPTSAGKACCAVVLDAFSRLVVGRSIDSYPTASLGTDALGMAIENRGPSYGETVVHRDQGTQFTSRAFTQRAIESRLHSSMGSIGDCYDNAVIESFSSRMQVELPDCHRSTTDIELANAIVEFLEFFHDWWRCHSSLGMLTSIGNER